MLYISPKHGLEKMIACKSCKIFLLRQVVVSDKKVQ